jgi:predicted RecA/RadA family phage recombinase
MAKNMRLPEALHLELPVPVGTLSGDIVAIGAWRGIAQTDRDVDGNATVWVNGSATITVDNAVATVGLPIYIAGTGVSLRATTATATATANTLIGYSLGTKAAASGPLEVGLCNGPSQA